MGRLEDPMTAIGAQRDIAAALPAERVQYHEFANAGHGVVEDAPEQVFSVIRNFIQSL